jgi:hypothetical protein
MVESKAPLIKKALGVDDLPIPTTETEVQFPWFKMPLEHEAMMSYSRFIERLCKTASAKKRVTATAPEVFDNEAFSMRVWMVSLGMKGEEYSTIRKRMLAPLSGNSGYAKKVIMQIN